MSIKPYPMRDAFLERVYSGMCDDLNIFIASADFGAPVLDKIRDEFPDRFVNVGIAEQNLINVSAGLALEGYTVFAYAIAPFITMRCYEQIRVNLALLSRVRTMNVNLVGVGAGFSYVVSGPTHQCYEDLTLMRAMPDFGFLSPSDHLSAAAMFDVCISTTGPKYLRFDAQPLPVIYEERVPDRGRGFEVLRSCGRICLIATGYMVHTALAAAKTLSAEGIESSVLDIFNIGGFSKRALYEVLNEYAAIVTLEEGFCGRGGLDAMIFDFSARNGLTARLLNIGVEGSYRFELGTRAELHERVGIGLEAVVRRVREIAH